MNKKDYIRANREWLEAKAGWTINGKKFDSSRAGVPVAFRLSDLIEGWIIAIQQITVGAKWEIYLQIWRGVVNNKCSI